MSILEDEILDLLDALGPRAHLVALCDMAELGDKSRSDVHEFFAGRTYPLLRDPAWQALHPYSPLLLGATSADSAGHTQLAGAFTGKLRGMAHGWIVSTIAPERLAEHLSRAFVARGPDGSAYLLRYYDPWVLPVLYYKAPQHWWKELITPIAAWWVPKADTEIQRWGRISGLSASQANPLPPLLIDQALWQALIGDPLPRRLLQSVETLLPGLLDAPCRGVRLACIEQLLDGARKAGLSTHDDLHDYVFLSLTQGTTRLAADRRWLWAMHAATAGEGRLGDLYSTACRQQA